MKVSGKQTKPEYEPQDEGKKEAENVIQIKKLEVRDLNFRFPGKSLLLKDINFELKKGEIITFFGEIGCGRSTLLSVFNVFIKLNLVRFWSTMPVGINFQQKNGEQMWPQ